MEWVRFNKQLPPPPPPLFKKLYLNTRLAQSHLIRQLLTDKCVGVVGAAGEEEENGESEQCIPSDDDEK